MTIMLEEIKSQPEILAGLQVEAEEIVGDLAAKVMDRGIDLIILAARGTSDHAAVYGQYLLTYMTGLPVALAAPSLVTLYRRPLKLANALVIGLSQSGEAADVNEYLAAAREGGALTAVITNNSESTMAKSAEHLLLCRAGVEHAVAATKTYMAEMALLAMFSLALSPDQAAMPAEFAELPRHIAATINLEEEIKIRTERYAFIDECVVLARGFNQATALETALKIQETSHIGAKGFSAADFLHGPIAMIHRGVPTLFFAPSGVAMHGLLETALKVRERGGELIIFSDDESLLSLGKHSFPLPSVAEWLSPFTCITAAQLFACYLALAKGYNPDRPRGLTKVTVTH